MNLKEFLNKYRLTPAELAVRCTFEKNGRHAHVTVATIYNILRGRKANKNSARAIQKGTDGLVTFKELRGKDDSRYAHRKTARNTDDGTGSIQETSDIERSDLYGHPEEPTQML